MPDEQIHRVGWRLFAALLSLCMPGLGQIVQYRTRVAATYMGIGIAGWFFVLLVLYFLGSLHLSILLAGFLPHFAAVLEAGAKFHHSRAFFSGPILPLKAQNGHRKSDIAGH